jgi:DNA-binding PadR family transcriptional regulator
MPPKAVHPAQFLPLPPLDFQLLTLLADGQLHGYGMVQAAAEAFPGQPGLEIGSLYRIIGRLLDDRLIHEVDHPHGETGDRRVRRYYVLTSLGRAVGKAEADRLRALLAHPATLKLLGARR